MSASLFEQFLESIKSLPCDVTRSLSLIRDLDEKVQGIFNINFNFFLF